jgi:hypothetical protein
MLEARFVRLKSVASQSAVFILAKAPTYRMNPVSEAPISTSQHYGNLYNRYGLLSTQNAERVGRTFSDTPNPLLTKAVTTAAIASFLKPRKNSLKVDVLGRLSTKVKNNSLKVLTAVYQNLLYTPATIAYPLLNTKVEETEVATSNTPYLGLYRALNLKSKSVMRRFFKKTLTNSQPTSHKTVFTEDARLISKNKKNT